MNFAASVPGTNWQQVSTGKIGNFSSERWENADKSLFYRVSTDPDYQLNGSTVDHAALSDYLDVMHYPNSTLDQTSYFLGHSAVRLEAIDDDYHYVEYAFVLGFQQFYIGAGASNDTWESGGKESVEAILNTVKSTLSK